MSLTLASSDAWITTKTKLALWTGGGVHSTRVHVDTIDGTVTLYGSVEDASQKEKAKSIAASVKGVTQVRNLLQVVPKSQQKAVEASDDEIKKQLEDKLKHDDLLAGSHITVKSVDKGVVLLGGKADSLIDHLVAIEDADAIDGVRSVRSEVQSPDQLVERETVVIYGQEKPKNSRFNDMRITSAVKLRLLSDGDTPATKISVDTSRGYVTLFGTVDNEKQKVAAETDARKVDGVQGVQNELQVVPPNEQKQVADSDDAIRNRTKELLSKHTEFNDVTVDVNNGVVRLSGKVPSNWDRVHVATLARTSTGARSVEADVTVKKK